MFGLQPWDIEIGSNFKNMALEIAKHNRVLYVNRPLDRITYLKKRSDRRTKTRLASIQGGEGIITAVSDTLAVLNPAILLESVNWMPHGFLYRYFNRRNSKKIAREIKRAAEKMNFTNPILMVDNDFFNGLYLKEYLDVNCMVYYIRDYLLSQAYFSKHGKYAEPALIAKADIVAANSLYLCRYAKQYNKNSTYIGQGCDVDDFMDKPDRYPDDISSVAHPVIGYCGMLSSARLDIKLIESIATQRPSWNIVLVGPEDEVFRQSHLHRLPNVFFTGIKPPELLPGYIHGFDVCINPQLINQMTIGNYPRKIDEYLAAGKPVAATQTETMQDFKEYVYLCNDAREYIAAIERALAESGGAEIIRARQLYARSHSWQASIEKLYTEINHLTYA